MIFQFSPHSALMDGSLPAGGISWILWWVDLSQGMKRKAHAYFHHRKFHYFCNMSISLISEDVTHFFHVMHMNYVYIFLNCLL